MATSDNSSEEEDRGPTSMSRRSGVGRRKRDRVQPSDQQQQVAAILLTSNSSVAKLSNNKKMTQQRETRSPEPVKVTRFSESSESCIRLREKHQRYEVQGSSSNQISPDATTSSFIGHVRPDVAAEVRLLEEQGRLQLRNLRCLSSCRQVNSKRPKQTIHRFENTMWPSWRMLVILSIMTFLTTSLLTSLNMMNLMPSCPIIFNHCHALSVVTKPSSGSNSSVTGDSTAITSSSTKGWTIPSSTSTTTSSPASVINQQQQHVYNNTTRQAGKISHLSSATIPAANSDLSPKMQSIESSRIQPHKDKQLSPDDESSAFDLVQAQRKQQSRIKAKLMQLSNANNNNYNASNQSNNGPKVNNNNNQDVGSGDTDKEPPAQNNNGRESLINRVEKVDLEPFNMVARRVVADGPRQSLPGAANEAGQARLMAESASNGGGLNIIQPGGTPWAPAPVKGLPQQQFQAAANNMSRQQENRHPLVPVQTEPPVPSAINTEGWSYSVSEPPRAQFEHQMFPPMQQAIRQQASSGYLLPHPSHILLQDVVREALNDLMSGTNEHILSAASAARPLVLRPQSLLASSSQHNNGYLRPALKSLQSSLGVKSNQQRLQKPLLTTASASAPSISLPPLSHFLVPRNPFRLFSSSSTPKATRHKPKNNQQPQASSSRQHPVKQQVSGNGFGRWFYPVQSAAFQGMASLPEPDTVHTLGNGIGGPATSGRLYAHTHSVEQLEQLVRAASRANGQLQSPILPAIVSAPTGPFPGFYIPAIESESESQVQEMRHGESPSGSITSKIPGTDYVLHPDEVRAMINIGELAWRKQDQQQQQQQAAGSRLHNIQQQQQQQHNGIQQTRQQQQVDSSEVQHWRAVGSNGQAGLMQENHAANVRDFAYVDPTHQNRRDNPIHQVQNQNQNYRNGANGTGQMLESQLVDHFNQKRLNSFPAIIRVNDQDYVHWPLLKLGNQNQNQHYGQQESMINQHRLYPSQHDESRKALPKGPWSFEQQSSDNQQVGQLFTLAAHPAFSMQTSSSHLRPRELEQSPMRLATQLTPTEIRQVEDSIIEALILAQTAQQQRKLMQVAASQQAITHERPDKPVSSSPMKEQTNQAKMEDTKNSRFRTGFFGLRRRRNLPNQQNTGSQQQLQQHSISNEASAADMVAISPLALTAARPIHIVTPLIPLVQPDIIAGTATDMSSNLIVPTNTPNVPQRSSRSSQVSMPALMADQETNKPGIVPEKSQDSGLYVESSVPNMAIVESPFKMTGLSSSVSARVPMMRQMPYGSRVSEQTASGQPVVHRYREEIRPEQAMDIERPRTTQRQNNLIATHHPTNHHRINVDWPGMMSDADYFPPHGENLQENSHSKGEPAKSGSRNIGRQNLASSQLRKTDNKNYVSSQVKLQFAQDYQAREGVPIYNNNVGAPGALDRARGSSGVDHYLREHSFISSNARPDRAESGVDNTSDVDEYSDGTSDEASDDLLQRGSGLSNVHDPSRERRLNSRAPESKQTHVITNKKSFAHSLSSSPSTKTKLV